MTIARLLMPDTIHWAAASPVNVAWMDAVRGADSDYAACAFVFASSARTNSRRERPCHTEPAEVAPVPGDEPTAVRRAQVHRIAGQGTATDTRRLQSPPSQALLSEGAPA